MMTTKALYSSSPNPLYIAIASRIVILVLSIFFPFLMDINSPFLDSLMHYDTAWYERIAKYGYGLDRGVVDQRVAFFPLFPLTTRLLPLNFILSSFIINNFIFIVSVPLFFTYMQQVALRNEALIATILLTFSPYSFYFSVAYTESIFLFLTLYLFYFTEKKEWYKALILAPFISATRNIGVFIVFPLGLIALKQFGWRNIFTFQKESIGAWLTIFAVPLGLVAYMVFLYYYTGDAFAFKNIQLKWDRLPPLEGVKQLIPALFNNPSVKEIYHAFFFLLAISLSIYLLKLKYYYQSLWLLLTALLGAITGTFTSMARFTMAGSPFIYMALSILITRNQWLKKMLH